MSDSSPPRQTAAAAPAVRIRGLTKRFGHVRALREVDLEISRGSLVAVRGPNGAGKTTLLRILATLHRPTEGRVEVLGFRHPEEGDEIRRRVGFLPPEGFLYDQLTAAENLRFSLLMSGIRPGEEEIGRALADVGLGRFAEALVRGFSSGMRKRLAVGRLLLRPVEMILLDEPYANLDREGVALVDALVDRWRDEGRTVLIASHQAGRSVDAAGRVVSLRAGRLAAEG